MIALPTKKDMDKKNSPGPWFPNLRIHKAHLESILKYRLLDPIPSNFDTVVWGWSLGICIFHCPHVTLMQGAYEPYSGSRTLGGRYLPTVCVPQGHQ